MYKVSRNWQDITEIDIVRKTDLCFWVLGYKGKEQRELIKTNYTVHFDTWEEAKNHIVARELRALNDFKEAVIRAERSYQSALQITKE